MNAKKILALILVAVLTAGLLSGCGPNDTGTLKVGGIAPMSGSLATYGISLQRGAQLAAEEINALGAVQFDLRFEDDENDPEKSVAAYRSLEEWGMKVFLGSATSAPNVATSGLSNADLIFTFNPTESSTEALGGTSSTPRREHVFQMGLSDAGQGDFSAQYLKGQFPDSKVAVLYESDNPFSTGACNSFQTTAGALGLNIVSISSISDSNDDFTAQLTAARDSGADLVFLPVYYDTAALVLTQANKLGYSPSFFGTDGMSQILSADDFDPALAENLMFIASFLPIASDGATKKFIEAYQAKYNELPNQFAAAAYDSIHAIYGSLYLSQGLSTMNRDQLTPLMTELVGGTLVFTGLSGDDLNWDETGTSPRQSRVAVIRDGVCTWME